MPEYFWEEDLGGRGRQRTHRVVDSIATPRGGRSWFDSTSVTRSNNRNSNWDLLPARDAFRDFGLQRPRSKSVGRQIMEDFGLVRRRPDSPGPWDGFEAVRQMSRGPLASPALPRFGNFEQLGECEDCGATTFRRAGTGPPLPARPFMQRSRSSRESRTNERYVYEDGVYDRRGRDGRRRRHGYSHEDPEDYWRREERKKKLFNGAEAAASAVAMEAVRLRKQPGSFMSGEKVARFATVAASTYAIEALIHGDKSDKVRRKLSSAVGGLLVNRMINGPRSGVNASRER